ncbi:3-phosphoshikimate 1-carboxyvinyltransferase [Parapedobacter indicus]|uniref:3-phosphoshikimate 1-carboxyvinyltransferase n=1 Tax=Parapedobacter indicus TaxID=1477437 RepID=A0A1I3EUQ4_9SPHI|nr:3-phosphoshikimate 1-carboxyvinyltransferase [Parapedobacter indicus]PPL03420.1 3-phosphoshikimate 1-carboxyvinyltransferase [Parapedobacter indicus]SFI02696.1 3-phosphoshikimate 1-carboxyvinyltransferase [Parapedobacter indicus]
MENNAIRLSHPTKTLKGAVELTGSKSESNRALIIQAWGGGLVEVGNLSSAADTETLKQALRAIVHTTGGDGTTVIDVGPAGTAMRFLTAYLPTTNGRYLLTGSERMKQRPIGILVDALRTLGAHVEFTGQTGYPPLAINGGFNQATDAVTVKGDVSSQYLSALLLIAPTLPNGLRLQIEGELTSRPYLVMTLDMLGEAGIQHDWQGDTIYIAPQRAHATRIVVEPDWSAASYWYAMAALSAAADLFLPNLKSQSLQGDAAIVNIMAHFGITSSFTDGGLSIRKIAGHQPTGVTLLDFKECPDLAQTVIVCAAALRRDLSFTGLHTLKIKETDRIAALQNELGKFGVKLVEDGSVYHLRTAELRQPEQLSFDTYEDHRMAMAFAPLALVFDGIQVNEPNVVEKSYPDFWKHLKQHGFVIT